jgi:ABC-type Na+ efflux pump permease subunit
MFVEDISAIGDLEINQSCKIDVDGILKTQAALDAAIGAAQVADELWKESEFERQQARQARMAEYAKEADRIRDELTDAQADDRDATRTLLGQLVAHRSANTQKRINERMAWENKFKSDDAKRAFEREQYEASKIAGMDPKTITFFAVGLFCLIFLIIFAVKM